MTKKLTGKELNRALLTATIKKADDYTVEELENEVNATGRFGEEIPMSIGEKRSLLRFFDAMRVD